jgi:cytochrome c oxidase subunit 2
MSMPRLPRSRFRTLAALIVATLLLAGCDAMRPPVAVTEQGQSIRDLYDFVFLIAVGVFVLVEGLIVIAVIRFRRRPGDTELPKQVHGNNALEILWTIIPTALVGVMFVLSFITLTKVDEVKGATDIRIRAVAAQFQWSFQYLSPDGTTVLFEQLAPEMDVPAGKVVHLSLRSNDVIHAFYVPQFLFKRDVVPGLDNTFEFTVNASDAGQTFRGQCAELCGTYHGAMLFTVKALSPADYDTWLADQIAKAKATPAPSGSTGAAVPGAVTLELAAKDVAFDKTTLEAPADKPFSIHFQNGDASVSHNVAIKDATGQEVFHGDIFMGVDAKTYSVPALAAGSYTFVCSVHPQMTGTLTVK